MLVRGEDIGLIAILSLVAAALYYALGWILHLLGKLFYFVLVAVLVILVWLMYTGKL